MKKWILFVATATWLSTGVYADVDCESLASCKFTRKGTPCATEQDCPAIRLTVDEAQVVPLGGTALHTMAACGGEVAATLKGDIKLPEAGTWIVYLHLDSCSAEGAPYSINWRVDACDPLCGDHVCRSPQPNCDAAEGEEPPAINLIQALRQPVF